MVKVSALFQIATASIKGRIALDYFGPSTEAQSQKYAFKFHRQTVSGEDHVWLVNSLESNPQQVSLSLSPLRLTDICCR